VFGWSEPVWTHGADQTRAVEIGALLALAPAMAIAPMASRRARGPVARTAEA
jgi:hypothetical protein